jgi:alkyl hydroperoxide reductase subunit F
VRDLIIVGAGPAGITAAIYAARKKMDFMVLSVDIGGQTAWSSDVENYTGFQFITGLDLTQKFEEHLKQFKIDVHTNESVNAVTRNSEGSFSVATDKTAHEARTVIIASGRRPRSLDAKGVDAYRNKGIAYCATCDGPLYAKKDVAIIGGGNSALDAALQMMRLASRVYLVNINAALEGDVILREKVEASPRVEILNNTTTEEIFGDKFVTGVRVSRGGQARDLAVKGVFIEIGSIPNTGMVADVRKNSAGEIMVDNLNRTNVPGLFAAGDVTDVPEKQIIVAAGEGAKAVLGVFKYLSSQK